jgi:hypothetical protein
VAIPDDPAQEARHAPQTARRAQPAWEYNQSDQQDFSPKADTRKAFPLPVIILQAKLNGSGETLA